MAVDFDKFVQWAEDRFDHVVVKGNEVRVDSIFTDDHKQHMWCNPYGGKHDRQNGVFHCWKTDKYGSLITLVMMVDKCSYEQACETLETGDVDLRRMEKEVEAFIGGKYDTIPKEEPPADPGTFKLPPYSYLISDLNESNLHRVQAELYLFNRGLNSTGLYICTTGDYRNRIIIPYYDRDGNLIYFNGRYIGTNKKVLRYMGPPKEVGVGKEDVVYVPKWPEWGERIYLTEGELDALTLRLCEFYSGAFGGKNFSEVQAEIIRGLCPTLCLDNDTAGGDALPKIGDFLKSKGFSDVRFIRPPTKYKDWNKMLEECSVTLIKHYILRNEKPYYSWTGDELRYKSLV